MLQKMVPFCYLKVYDLPIFSPVTDISPGPALNTNTPRQMQLDPLSPLSSNRSATRPWTHQFLTKKQHHQASNLLQTLPLKFHYKSKVAQISYKGKKINSLFQVLGRCHWACFGDHNMAHNSIILVKLKRTYL